MLYSALTPAWKICHRRIENLKSVNIILRYTTRIKVKNLLFLLFLRNVGLIGFTQIGNPDNFVFRSSFIFFAKFS